MNHSHMSTTCVSLLITRSPHLWLCQARVLVQKDFAPEVVEILQSLASPSAGPVSMPQYHQQRPDAPAVRASQLQRASMMGGVGHAPDIVSVIRPCDEQHASGAYMCWRCWM